MKTSMNRWVRGVCGIILMLFLGAMYAWSYFNVALSSVYPDWSQKQLALTFTIMMSCFCLGGLVAGSFLTKVKKSRQLLIAAVLVAAGFFGASILPEGTSAALIQLYLCYGVLNGFGTGIAYNAVISGIQPWFPDCPGLISGALLMGMGFGSLLLGIVASKLIPVLNLFGTFRVFAIAMLVILVLGTLFLRLPGANDSLPAPKVKQAAASSQGLELNSKEMLRRPTFWLYFLWNLCVSAGGMLVINSASKITAFYGLAAVIGLLVSVFNGLGRLGVGSCMDRLGWKKTMYLNNAILLLSGLTLCVGGLPQDGIAVVVLIGMLLMGVCYGGGITISAALIRQLYGSKHFASNFSVCNLCMIPGSILGPILSAALYDASGDYRSTFIMVVVLGVVTLIMNLFIRKP